MRIYLRSLAPRDSNPCYRRERAISPRQEPSFSPSLVEPSWAALRSGPLSAAASRVQSAALSASFFLVPNDTQRRCRPRYKLTGRRRQLRTHKAVPAGAAPRMWSTDSTSRPSSHLPGRVVAFGDAADADHQYPTRVECRENTAHLPRRRGALHRLVRDPRPNRFAGLPGDNHRLLAAETRGTSRSIPCTCAILPAPSPGSSARAVAGQGEGALVLDRLRFVLLTIRNTFAGLRDRRQCQSASPRHCHRARSSGSKHAKLCATRTAPSFIRPWRKND
jgi:hypothetical protein